MALITADNRLLVTHRSSKNDPYGDMPGASVAGYIDAQFDRKTRTIKPLTTQDVKDNIVREMEEELGLERNDLTQLSLDGLVLEKSQVHHEFVFSGNLSLTSDEVKQKSIRERNMHPEEFEERFVDIEASPEAIFDLLTKLDCPIPPTHTAVFAATGYRLVLERDGLAKAQEYKSVLEEGVRKNSLRIDSLVENFYQQNPDVLSEPSPRQEAKIQIAMNDFENKNPNTTDEAKNQFRESLLRNLPPRKINGYNAFYLPSEQGLPDFNTALRNVGLVK